jgi:thiol-disulfide isomerase/thioredoxin
VRVSACVALLACCLSLTGCSLFGKRPSSGPNAAAGGGGGSSLPSLDRNPGTPTALDRTNPPSQFGGILAGQVVDAYGTKHSSASIQVVDSREQGAAPIEVAADPNGYFTIQGLNPGRSYQLVARVREADKLVAAGTTYATPPNPRLVIRVSEEFVSPTTPPLPPYPALPGAGGPARPATPEQPKKPAATLERPQPNGGTPAPTPEHSVEPPPSPARAGAELMPPRVTPGAVAPSENFVREEPPRGPNAPRPATIPGPPVPSPVPSPGLGPTSNWQPQSPQIPFCLVSNQKLENLALYDVNGQPWEFRRNNHARLVLLDFWGTWCPPCRAAIPHLVQMQRQYGQQGLDVIGIAYEEGTTEEQTRKVKATRDRMGINYRLLLGADADRCPVKSQMAVSGFPTLILVDEYGNMLWRSEGLDSAKARQLDGEVRRRLGLR